MPMSFGSGSGSFKPPRLGTQKRAKLGRSLSGKAPKTPTVGAITDEAKSFGSSKNALGSASAPQKTDFKPGALFSMKGWPK